MWAVAGIDLFDSTPVIDIKPYQPDYQVNKYTCLNGTSNLWIETGIFRETISNN